MSSNQNVSSREKKVRVIGQKIEPQKEIFEQEDVISIKNETHKLQKARNFLNPNRNRLDYKANMLELN